MLRVPEARSRKLPQSGAGGTDARERRQHYSQRASGKEKGRNTGRRTARSTTTIWRKSKEDKSMANTRQDKSKANTRQDKSKANGRREEQCQQQAKQEAATKQETRQEDDAEHSKSTAAKTTRTKDAKDFSNSEIKQEDATDTLKHAISIIEKEMIKTLVSEQKDTEHSVNSVDEEAYHRADHDDSRRCSQHCRRRGNTQ